MNRVLFDARMAYIKLIRNWFYSGLSMMTISLTLLLPIGLLFVVSNVFQYYSSYIPQNPSKTISLTMKSNTEENSAELSLSNNLMDKLITYSPSSSAQQVIKVGNSFRNAKIVGIEQSYFDISAVQILFRKNGFMPKGELRENHCLIGHQLAKEINLDEGILLHGHHFEIDGVVFNRMHDDIILLKTSDFLAQGGKINNYLCQLKDTESLASFQKELSSVNEDYHVISWGDFFEKDNRMAIQFLIGGALFVSIVILYGFANILSLFLHQIEIKDSEAYINIVAGATNSDLMLQASIYNLAISVCSSGIVVGILYGFREKLFHITGLPIDVNRLALFLLLPGLLLFVGVLSTVVQKKQVKLLKTFRRQR